DHGCIYWSLAALAHASTSLALGSGMSVITAASTGRSLRSLMPPPRWRSAPA
ncbi:hypothetical protein ABIA39_007925, partial [Nocardia sp. GAS34]